MPANPLSHIPLIDLAPYFAGDRADKKRVADEMSRACEHIGFFLVSGHQVDRALIEGVQRESKAFFALPLEEKLEIKQRKELKGSRGYEPVGTEQLSATIGVETPPDLKESYSLGPLEVPDHPSCRTEAAEPLYRPNMWPRNPATLRPMYEDYIRAMDGLSLHLHRLAAIALDLPVDYFEDKIDRGFSLLRVLNYPDQRQEPEAGQLRAGEHSDYDNLTICLIEDKPGGLQARSPDGAWVDVPFVAGSFVVNIGDFLMRWTNDRWKSTRHRVVNPPLAAGERLSACHFIMPNHDAVIECLPTCQSPEQPAKYPPILAGDYMIEKFESQASGEEWSDEESRRFGTADTETRFTH